MGKLQRYFCGPACNNYKILNVWLPRVLILLVLVNTIAIVKYNLINFYTKSSYIEKIRFNIPVSWQKFQISPPTEHDRVKKEQLKLSRLSDFPNVPHGQKLDPDSYDYGIYASCRVDMSTITFYVLSELSNSKSRTLIRQEWRFGSKSDAASNLLFIILGSPSDAENPPDSIMMERAMFGDILMLTIQPHMVSHPEMSAIIDHAANCEHNVESLGRHLIITKDTYFWRPDILQNRFLNQVDSAESNQAIMLGNIDFGDNQKSFHGFSLPAKCTEAGCIITKHATQALHNAMAPREGYQIYSDDPMTYISLLAHRVNQENRQLPEPEIRIQYHSDSRFWSERLESSTEPFNCNLFNFPVKYYSEYKKKCNK